MTVAAPPKPPPPRLDPEALAGDALGTAALWLGRSFGGHVLQRVDSGAEETRTEKGQLLRRVPFVRFDYGAFTLMEYGSQRPYGREDAPRPGTSFFAPPLLMIFERDGVLLFVDSPSHAFQLHTARALELARALRPLPAG